MTDERKTSLKDFCNAGKKVKLILPNQIFYSGVILYEDNFFIFIRDKFEKEVRLSKSYIVSMEVLE